MKYISNLSSVYGSTYVIDDVKPIDAIKQKIADDCEGESGRFFHMSVDEMLERVDMWRELLPRVTPHYAVKCNNGPSVLQTLDILGVNFDCASRGEINQVLKMGVDPSRIIFAHPCKVVGDIKYAKSRNVSRMTFDCPAELHKTARLYPGASLLLRLRCDAAAAQCMLGIKFGALPQETRQLLALAAQLGLRVVGVAFHVGSGCAEPKVFLRAIAAAKQVFEEAVEEGHNPTVLDIGGGFVATNFEETAGYINEALDTHFPEGCGVEVIAEPGRYMVSTALTLATPVINRRDLGEGNEAMVFIDDGLYGSFNCILYENKLVDPVVIDERLQEEETLKMSVWGPTCDSMDQVLESVALPRSLKGGDWLVWPDMGAYTVSAACNFNGFEPAPVVPHLSAATERRLLDLLMEKTTDADCETSSGFVSDDEAASEASDTSDGRNNKFLDAEPSIPSFC